MKTPPSPHAARGSPRVPIRVLHVTAVESPNYYLNNLAEFSDPDVVRHFAATLGKPGGFVEELRRRGVGAWALSCPQRSYYPYAVSKIVQLAAETGAHVIHGHLFEPAFLGAVGSRLAPARLVLTRHHSDAVHRLRDRWRRVAYLLVERFVNRTARRIIAPSVRVREVLTTLEGVAQEKVKVVPYPQTASRFEHLRPREQVRAELGMDQGIMMACVSRLHPEKGHSVLLEALPLLVSRGCDLRLYLLGEGNCRLGLEERLRALGLRERVVFLGWRDDALSIVAASDIVVHPSLHEALPSAVIEALMLERPIVASDVSGVRDILGNDEYGRMVPPGDVEGLAAAVLGTLADPSAARNRARAGRKHVLEYMDAGRVAEAHLDCYRQALVPH